MTSKREQCYKRRIAELETQLKERDQRIATLEKQVAELENQIGAIDNRLEKHAALAKELKDLKAAIKASVTKKDDMVAAARAKISDEQAKQLILARFLETLLKEYEIRLNAYVTELVKAVESLHNKYAVTAEQIVKSRDKATKELDNFLKELGYVA